MRHYYLFLKKSSLLTILFCCAFHALQAQDPNSGDNTMLYNKSSSPSNNTSSLPNSAANLTADLYTGRLQGNIPIFVLESSDLKIPISLNYTAGGGVKPSDPNNTVGMNWNLFAGGSISRVVRGIPDESDEGYIGNNNAGDYTVFNQGMNVILRFYDYTSGLIEEYNNTYNKRVPGIGPIDGEPDLFYISTPMFNAQFVIDENGNPVFQNNTGLKVIHQLYKNTSLASFTGIIVIDDQGNQYIFGNQNSTREVTTTKFFGQSFTFTSTWYLEKIILFNSKDVINFTYMNGNDYTVYSYLQNTDFTSTFPSGSGFPPTGAPVSFSNYATLTTKISTVTYNGPKYISQISTKLGEADFTYTYNPNTNISASNPPALTSITIKQFNPQQNSNNIVLKTFNFSYTDLETGVSGYTQPYPFPDIWSDYYRRLLSGITVTGNTTQTSTPLTLYSFKYYQLLPYPDRGIPQDCDFWGYPNSNGFVVEGLDAYYFTNADAARVPTSWTPAGTSQVVPSAAQFALQELDNVNGGATIVNYDQNTYYDGSSNVPVGGARVSSIVHKVTGRSDLTTSYVYNDASGHSTGQLWSDLYKRVTVNFGTACCNYTTLCLSQSPYGIADDQGVSVGYSSVKTISPNGGYEVDNFADFNDFPDIITEPSLFVSATNRSIYNYYLSAQISSFSYKRGLVKSSAIYTASGNPVSQITNTYASLDAQPVIKGIGIQDMTWYMSSTIYLESLNTYNINVENWRLTQVVRKDYDQLTPANYVQTTATYTYAADKRLLKSITETDSKGLNRVQTFYHADDVSIPMVTTSEQQAINAMVSANYTNTMIHETESRNGIIHQSHRSFSIAPIGNASNIYLASDAKYAGSTLLNQNTYNYDASTSQMISSINGNSEPTSVFFAYNTTYPVAKVVNALNTATFVNQVATVTNTLNINGVFVGAQQMTFTTVSTGTITIACPPGIYLAQTGGATIQIGLVLSGPTGGSGALCNNSTAGYTCATGNSVSFTSMPAGNYTLSLSINNNTSNTPVSVTSTYMGYQIIPSGSTEFFYEGFEQNPSATAGNAHTGNMYLNFDYTVAYSPPNSRKYIIQWWSLVGGKWVFNEQPYVNSMTLSGPVDDVRVFPSDAMMTTYTYSPLLGRTSETDPSGKTETFEYDGLGRILRVRDQDGNILKQYDYQYHVGLQQ